MNKNTIIKYINALLYIICFNVGASQDEINNFVLNNLIFKTEGTLSNQEYGHFWDLVNTFKHHHPAEIDVIDSYIGWLHFAESITDHPNPAKPAEPGKVSTEGVALPPAIDSETGAPPPPPPPPAGKPKDKKEPTKVTPKKPAPSTQKLFEDIQKGVQLRKVEQLQKETTTSPGLEAVLAKEIAKRSQEINRAEKKLTTSEIANELIFLIDTIKEDLEPRVDLGNRLMSLRRNIPVFEEFLKTYASHRDKDIGQEKSFNEHLAYFKQEEKRIENAFEKTSTSRPPTQSEAVTTLEKLRTILENDVKTINQATEKVSTYQRNKINEHINEYQNKKKELAPVLGSSSFTDDNIVDRLQKALENNQTKFAQKPAQSPGSVQEQKKLEEELANLQKDVLVQQQIIETLIRTKKKISKPHYENFTNLLNLYRKNIIDYKAKFSKEYNDQGVLNRLSIFESKLGITMVQQRRRAQEESEEEEEEVEPTSSPRTPVRPEPVAEKPVIEPPISVPEKSSTPLPAKQQRDLTALATIAGQLQNDFEHIQKLKPLAQRSEKATMRPRLKAYQQQKNRYKQMYNVDFDDNNLEKRIAGWLD